eukprot:gene28011-31108_t
MVQKSAGTVAYTVYPITNYSFGGTKDRKKEKEFSVADRLQRLKTNYEKEGLRRSVEGVIITPWDVGECTGVYWRPNFDTVFYPYLPPHITKPKEVKRLFVVPLPEHCMFS